MTCPAVGSLMWRSRAKKCSRLMVANSVVPMAKPPTPRANSTKPALPFFPPDVSTTEMVLSDPIQELEPKVPDWSLEAKPAAKGRFQVPSGAACDNIRHAADRAPNGTDEPAARRGVALGRGGSACLVGGTSGGVPRLVCAPSPCAAAGDPPAAGRPALRHVSR